MAIALSDEKVTGGGLSVTEPEPAPSEIDDRLLRWIGVPGFGLSIPHLTGLFGALTPFGHDAATWWLGSAWFVLLAWLIWHGNRWLLFKQRQHVDWFAQPLRKIFLLLFGVAFGTIPVTVAMLAGWYRVAGLAPDWGIIQTVTLVNVICVVFVTHVYETVFLIKAREDDRVTTARLERARVEAELEALRAQVDPHFLFNSLNTLVYLIREDPARAEEFTARLARVYRYLIACRGRRLVLLEEELDFVGDYAALLALRFGDALRIERELGATAADRFLVPPASLQLLVENAVKHNEVSLERPLTVRLVQGGEMLTVENRRAPRTAVRSSGLGLANLGERVRLVTGHALEIEASEETFVVRLPLLRI